MIQDRGAMLTGLGIGASLMFFLDPGQGRRRRALARDKIVHMGHLAFDAAEATRRDMSNRASGVAARLRRGGDENADDRILMERVRAQLGRVASHPRLIDAAVADGVVTLRGPILQAEVDALCRAVGGVAGVRDVVNQLEPHADASNVPSLRGEGRVSRRWQGTWSPTTRMMTALLATAGAGLLARSLSGHHSQMQMH
jgi:BON domain